MTARGTEEGRRGTEAGEQELGQRGCSALTKELWNEAMELQWEPLKDSKQGSYIMRVKSTLWQQRKHFSGKPGSSSLGGFRNDSK